MLQKKEIPTTTKPNVTKQELPTTTIKKPIVENQTSGKIKTNVTKEGIPTTPTKIPVTPTKTNVTKEGIHKQRYQQHRQNLMLQKKEYTTTPTKTNVTKEGIPTTAKNTNNSKDTSNTDKT